MLDNIIEICVAIDIAILGIAYPIIVDKISNIGDKYSSEYISVVFNFEFPQKKCKYDFLKKFSLFQLFLYSTLLSFTFLIFKFKPIWGIDPFIVNTILQLIVLLLTMILIISFIIWLDKVVLFNGKAKNLLIHIIKKYNKQEKQEYKSYYLKAINELAFYALEQQDEHIQKTLLEFYYKLFSEIRRKHDKSKPLVYPKELYFLTQRINLISKQESNIKLKDLEHRAVSGVWLLGEDFQNIIISDETYDCLWSNIYNICDKPKLIKLFWGNSSQYYSFILKRIMPNFNFSKGIIENQEEVDFRENERLNFLEFQYAIGGLVIYQKQYELIRYFFEYSQSYPPKYELLPNSMTDIFNWFFRFNDDFSQRNRRIEYKYYFPELDNLGNKRQVVYWISVYICLLYVRQFTIQSFYTYESPLNPPVLPKTIYELNFWLDNLGFFRKCVNDVLNNSELLKDIDIYTQIEEKRRNIFDFIDVVEKQIKDSIYTIKEKSKITESYVEDFFISSKEIISTAFEEYNAVFNEYDDSYQGCNLVTYINGELTLMSKSAFIEDAITHLNFDSFFASSISEYKIKKSIPNSFAGARTQRYLIKKEDLFSSIDKIAQSEKEYSIIGVNLDYEIAPLIENSDYKDRLKRITSTDYRANNVIFIVKNTDLPAIEHKDISEEEIKQYQLTPINDAFKIYASVIDLNQKGNEEIKDKWSKDSTDNELEPKVQLAICFISVIYWKNDRQVIQLNINSEYEEQGILSDLNEIKPFY